VLNRLWMMPRCWAPSSVQQDSQFLTSQGNRSDLAFNGICVDGPVGILQEDLEGAFTTVDVGKGLGEGIAGR